VPEPRAGIIVGSPPVCEAAAGSSETLRLALVHTLAQEDLVGDAVLARQLRRVELLHGREIPLVHLTLLRAILGTEVVRQAVVVTVVANLGREERIEFQVLLEVPLEHRVQALTCFGAEAVACCSAAAAMATCGAAASGRERQQKRED